MSATARYVRTFEIGGKQFSETKSLSADKSQVIEKTLAAAKTGTLTTRTDANTGSLTLAASHGVVDGDYLDVYWSGGARRGMLVGTVATNVVPVDGGDGDDLPTASTALTVMVRQEEALHFAGDDLKALSFYCQAKATMVLAGSDDAEDWAQVTNTAGGIGGWSADTPDANPVAGDTIAKVFLSHGDSTGSKTIRVGVLHN